MLVPFQPSAGLSGDTTTFTAQGRWTAASNVRFYNGQPQVIHPFVSLFTLASTVYNMFAWDRGGTTHIAYGRSANVMVGADIATPTDRTPPSMGSGYTAFAFAAWGSTLLFVPSGKTLYEQSGTSTSTEVTQAPDRITWMLVTRRQVIAFGCNEVSSGNFNNLCIRGCDLEDYTNWTPTVANNSFEDILDGGGKIVTAREIGDYVAVWTDNSLYLGQYIGDPSQTYRWDRVAGNCGVVGPNAIVVVGQTAYWFSHDHHVHAWAPGAEVATLPCPIFNSLDLTLAGNGPTANALIALSHVSKFNEVWIYYSGGYAAFSIDEPHIWSAGDIERDAALNNDLLQSSMGAVYSTSIITSGGGVVYATECREDVSPTGPDEWYLQSADQYVDESQRRMMIRGIVPDFKALRVTPGPISLTVYCRSHPQATAAAKGPYALTSTATKKDFRASGKLMALLFSGGANTFVRFGKQALDVVLLGER